MTAGGLRREHVGGRGSHPWHVVGERGSSFGEERRGQVIMAVFSAGLHQPPSPAQAVTALAGARRMVASLQARGEPIADWLASEIRVHGIRENAAALAAMEIPEHRQMTAEPTPTTILTALKPSTTCWQPSAEPGPGYSPSIGSDQAYNSRRPTEYPGGPPLLALYRAPRSVIGSL
jgi:hypothetical protein